MTKHLTLVVLSGVLFCAYPFRMKAQYSQLDLPRESQTGTVTQRIGVSDITITYSRPSVKGRTVWGDIVPYGQVWRMGANENTVLTCTHEISIEGQKLPAGTYGLRHSGRRTNGPSSSQGPYRHGGSSSAEGKGCVAC
ncbi:MAG: DUF2911 domain-containing protein [Flavobacteriales bacterium]|nr:DUF2911 domain-containing protein [Flavobacteriales bacterium]